MLADSHCHLDFPELAGRLDEVLGLMRANGVDYALCVSVTLSEFPRVLGLAEAHEGRYASVGIHPDYPDEAPATVEELVRLPMKAILLDGTPRKTTLPAPAPRPLFRPS